MLVRNKRLDEIDITEDEKRSKVLFRDGKVYHYVKEQSALLRCNRVTNVIDAWLVHFDLDSVSLAMYSPAKAISFSFGSRAKAER